MYQMAAELPERLRLTDDEMLQAELDAQALTKRNLLKLCHKLWSRIPDPKHVHGPIKERLNRPRGFRTPQFEEGYFALKALRQPIRDWVQVINGLDPDAPADTDYLALANEITRAVSQATQLSG